MINRLLVDQGNTATKYQIWLGDHLQFTSSILNVQLDGLFFEEKQFDQIFISSVAEQQYLQLLRERLNQVSCDFIQELKAESCFGNLKNVYEQPAAMGVDRWLAMIGAHQIFGGDFKVLSFGTAFTLDVVDAQLNHSGGKIVPNFAMMQKNLLEQTGKIDFNANLVSEVRRNALGKSTQECVQYGLYSMIEAYIESQLRDFNSKTIVTGGGAMLFASTWSKHPVLWMNDLVLWGLKCWSEEAA